LLKHHAFNTISLITDNLAFTSALAITLPQVTVWSPRLGSLIMHYAAFCYLAATALQVGRTTAEESWSVLVSRKAQTTLDYLDASSGPLIIAATAGAIGTLTLLQVGFVKLALDGMRTEAGNAISALGHSIVRTAISPGLLVKEAVRANTCHTPVLRHAVTAATVWLVGAAIAIHLYRTCYIEATESAENALANAAAFAHLTKEERAEDNSSPWGLPWTTIFATVGVAPSTYAAMAPEHARTLTGATIYPDLWKAWKDAPVGAADEAWLVGRVTAWTKVAAVSLAAYYMSPWTATTAATSYASYAATLASKGAAGYAVSEAASVLEEMEYHRWSPEGMMKRHELFNDDEHRSALSILVRDTLRCFEEAITAALEEAGRSPTHQRTTAPHHPHQLQLDQPPTPKTTNTTGVLTTVAEGARIAGGRARDVAVEGLRRMITYPFERLYRANYKNDGNGTHPYFSKEVYDTTRLGVQSPTKARWWWGWWSSTPPTSTGELKLHQQPQQQREEQQRLPAPATTEEGANPRRTDWF